MKNIITLYIYLFFSFVFSGQLFSQVASSVDSPGCSDPAALNYNFSWDSDCNGIIGGTADWCCVYPVENNFCENAISLELNASPVFSSILNSFDTNHLEEGQEGSCWVTNLANSEIWFSFSSEGLIDIEITSEDEFQIAIYTNCSEPSVACSEENLLEGFCAEGNVEYLIEVEPRGYFLESFEIQVRTSVFVAEEYCGDILAVNYSSFSCGQLNNTMCSYSGCMDGSACNFEPLAITDDGSCFYGFGCMDESALNYDPNALCPDVCLYESGDFNGDGLLTSADLSAFLSSFGQSCDESEFCYGDFNNDQNVTTNDLSVFLTLMVAD